MDIITYKRDFCVLCDDSSSLQDITTLKMPLYAIYPENVKKDTWDMTYGYCEKCFSVQLKTLLDPNILYDKNYIQPVSSSYNWVQHNMSFINFIINAIEIDKPLIEVGSSSFCLGKHLIEYYKDYSVFDYSIEQAIKQENVKYIEGNCENYNFESNSNIIMSHVFEHLYEPKKFIMNCKNNGVKNIVIAIPNMNDLNLLHVFNLHTFLYSDNDIEYIFGINNYKLLNKVYFTTKDKSFPALFFHFELTDNIILIERNIISNRHNYAQNTLKHIIIPPNTFLITAGMMMLQMYCLIDNKENIIGVIDQNKLIQGKKFADTEFIIQPYEYLAGYDNNTNVFVLNYRKQDIINCIHKVNNNITNIITN